MIFLHASGRANRRALPMMILTTIFKQGDMQDQPLLSLTPENYPSLEFLEEAPARGSARRLEFAHEHRNGGGARRLYRPMMCAADVLRFLGTEFAQRAGGAAGAGAGAGSAPDEKKEKRLGRANPEHEHHAPGEPPHSAPPAAAARISDLERRVRAHQQGRGASTARGPRGARSIHRDID